MQISHIFYKDVPAVCCETEELSAVFLPEYGGKLTSLRNHRNGFEYMAQARGEIYRKPVYSGSYVDAECSACDDMFPTIDPFVSMEYPWKGVEYPDHGEVYALKWEMEILADSLHMWVYSVRFGYRLDKWIYEADGALKVRYQVENLTAFPLDYIYAPHCMFAAEEGMQIEVPYEEGELVTVIFSKSGILGGYGGKGVWPMTNGIDLSAPEPYSDKDNYKYFFDAPIPEGKCVLAYPDRHKMVFCFDETAMPYLGVWINSGGFKDMYNVAIEPCSGAFDRPDVAKMHGKNSVLNGYERKEWYLSFEAQNE